MEYQRDESAKWSEAVNKSIEKWETGVQTVLEKNAARGFAAPTGETLGMILDVTLETQMLLTEANGKIYTDQRERIYQMEEFNLKLAVELAKLILEWEKADLLNQIAEEQAQQDAQIEMWRGDIVRVNAEVERREAAIIMAKADIEQEITAYKEQEIRVEIEALGVEEALIQAKIATAQAKLAIIDSLMEVVNAEHLVVAAEIRRAAAMEEVLAAKEALAAIQQSTIPLHMQKAAAREEQATAATEEAQVKGQIESLGFQRIALKTAQEGADSAIRGAELSYEDAQASLVKATAALEVARNQARLTVQGASNSARTAVIAGNAAIKEGEIDIRLDAMLQRKTIESNAETSLYGFLAGLAGSSFANKIMNINAVGVSNAATIDAQAFQIHNSETHTIYHKRIHKDG